VPETAIQSEETFRELERGDVVFAMRPRVEGQPGVQRFFVMLGPEPSDAASSAPWRRVVVGKKRLPKPGRGEREWAYLDRLGETQDDLFLDLGPSTYATKTRGIRHQPGARIVATGSYRVVEHGTHVHLAWVLAPDDPARDAEMLETLGISERGSVVAAIFNPLAEWSRQATIAYGGDPDERTPHGEPSIFPDELQARFGKKRFLPLAPAYLDVVGAELVLMGAQDHLPGE
jgi:hypothetical protein